MVSRGTRVQIPNHIQVTCSGQGVVHWGALAVQLFLINLRIASCLCAGDPTLLEGVPLPFFPGILPSRKPPETQGKRPAFGKNDG